MSTETYLKEILENRNIYDKNLDDAENYIIEFENKLSEWSLNGNNNDLNTKQNTLTELMVYLIIIY